MTGPTDSELENAIEADYMGDSTDAVRALFAQHPAVEQDGCESEDVVREWAEDERDSCTLACHVLDVLAYVDQLRAEIERLRAHQGTA